MCSIYLIGQINGQLRIQGSRCVLQVLVDTIEIETPREAMPRMKVHRVEMRLGEQIVLYRHLKREGLRVRDIVDSAIV